jgi:hypothetical protein
MIINGDYTSSCVEADVAWFEALIRNSRLETEMTNCMIRDLQEGSVWWYHWIIPRDQSHRTVRYNNGGLLWGNMSANFGESHGISCLNNGQEEKGNQMLENALVKLSVLGDSGRYWLRRLHCLMGRPPSLTNEVRPSRVRITYNVMFTFHPCWVSGRNYKPMGPSLILSKFKGGKNTLQHDCKRKTKCFQKIALEFLIKFHSLD